MLQFRIRVDKLDDVDQCIIHYNQAVLLYHQRQFTQAVAIMDCVYKFVEAMGISMIFINKPNVFKLF